jgi:hypothetical protein
VTVVLAATWEPRGELPRLKRLMPLLRELYVGMVVVMPPEADLSIAHELHNMPAVQTVLAPEWVQGRWHSLNHALQIDADSIHYADLDRLVRWGETRPDELRQTVAKVQMVDCLMIGRTEAAFATHPHSLQGVERITNEIFGYLLGEQHDLPSGSKGFSRRAAAFLARNSSPIHGLGTDSEWAVLLHRAGFALTRVDVDGLDWETADRYQEHAADAERQRTEAKVYDQNPDHWKWRVEVAEYTVRAGLEAMTRELKVSGGQSS